MEGLDVVVAPVEPAPVRPPRSIVPGILAASMIAGVSHAVHLLYKPISPAILAILIGAIVRNTVNLPGRWIEACKGIVKRIIPVTIVLTGASLNLAELARLGAPSLVIILSAITCGCFGAIVAGRLFGTSRKTALLVGCGTAICGTSAIVAAAPVIDADNDDMLISISTINLLGLLVMLALPPLGLALHLGEPAFGVWAGTTVHAVPQAVTTGYSYGMQAGALATLVKLVRVALLAPFLIVLTLLAGRGRVRQARYLNLLPGFIWGFLALAALNTLGFLPELAFHPLGGGGVTTVPLASLLNELGTVLLTVSMAAMGLEVNLKFMVRTGVPALATGAAASAIQIAVTLLLITWLVSGH